MTDCMMIVEDLLEHNPGRSLIEILYLSTKTPYNVMASNLRRNGYGVLVLTEDELRRRTKSQNPIPNDFEKEQAAFTSSFLDFLTSLENRAKEDTQVKEKEAEVKADEYAKKVEAARQEMIKACKTEEKLKAEHEKSVLVKQQRLEAYLDLLDERRNYQ